MLGGRGVEQALEHDCSRDVHLRGLVLPVHAAVACSLQTEASSFSSLCEQWKLLSMALSTSIRCQLGCVLGELAINWDAGILQQKHSVAPAQQLSQAFPTFKRPVPVNFASSTSRAIPKMSMPVVKPLAVALASLLAGAAVVHRLYKPDLVRFATR